LVIAGTPFLTRVIHQVPYAGRRAEFDPILRTFLKKEFISGHEADSDFPGEDFQRSG
jgi:hypothetical protein